MPCELSIFCVWLNDGERNQFAMSSFVNLFFFHPPQKLFKRKNSFALFFDQKKNHREEENSSESFFSFCLQVTTMEKKYRFTSSPTHYKIRAKQVKNSTLIKLLLLLVEWMKRDENFSNNLRSIFVKHRKCFLFFPFFSLLYSSEKKQINLSTCIFTAAKK